MSKEFEIGKTYLIFPFSNGAGITSYLSHKWVICKVISITEEPNICLLRIHLISANSKNKHRKPLYGWKLYVPSRALGKRDREIENKTDLLFTTMEMNNQEETLNDTHKY